MTQQGNTNVCVTEETAATVIAASSYLSKAKEENSSANRFYGLQRMKRTCPLVLLGPEFSSQRTWAACCTTSQPVVQNSNTSVGLTHTHGEVQGGSLLLFLHPSFRRRAAVELFERAECECVGWGGMRDWIAHAHSVPRPGQVGGRGHYLESLADGRVQHGPVHSAVHPDRSHEEVVLLGLLLTNGSIISKEVVSRRAEGGPEWATHVFKDVKIGDTNNHSDAVVVPL